MRPDIAASVIATRQRKGKTQSQIQQDAKDRQFAVAQMRNNGLTFKVIGKAFGVSSTQANRLYASWKRRLGA